MHAGNTIHSDTLITKNKSMLAGRIDNETVMMDIENGEYYGLNSVGSRIWELLDTPLTLSRLCRILADEFETTEAGCLEDTREFITRLYEKKMIRLG